MIIQRRKINYILYFFIIIFSYTMLLDIIPINISWIVNRLFYLFILILFISYISKIKCIVNKSLYLVLFLYLYCIFYLISMLKSQPFELSILAIIGRSVFYIISFIILLCVVNEFKPYKILLPFLISTIFIILLSVLPIFGYEFIYYNEDFNKLTQRVDALKSSLMSDGFIRYSGVFLNQNTLGLILMIGFGIALILYDLYQIKYKNYDKKVLLFIYISLFGSLFFIFITLSRASILSLLIIISIYTIKNINNKYYIRIFFILICGFSIFFFFNIDTLIIIYNRFVTDVTSSRNIIWEDAWNVFSDNPMLGVGNFVHYREGKEYTSHNIYLHILVNNGIFAAFFWFSWAFYYIFLSLKNILIPQYRKSNLSKLNIIGLYLAILTHQMFETNISSATHPAALIFMILIV